MEYLGHLLALVGVATPFAFSALLDKLLKNELKAKLSAYVYGAGRETVSQRMALFSTLLASALGVGLLKKSVRLLLIGLLSIVFVYSLQYFFRPIDFQRDTLPFLESLRSLRPFAIYVLISFASVDAISFFQTATFSRLAAYCKNPVEVMFLAFADIVVSLFLVIIFLPLFLFASYRIAAVPHDNIVKIALLEGGQSQNLTMRDIVLLAAPDVTSTSRTSDPAADVLTLPGWFYTNPRMYVVPGREQMKLEDVVKGNLPSAGGSLLFTNATQPADVLASRIATLIKSDENISDVKVMDAENDMFGNGVYTFEIHGKSEYSALTFYKSYGSIMGDINFFGNDFYNLLSLGSKTVDENEITHSGILSSLVEQANGNIVFTCDGSEVRTAPREEFLKLTEKQCVNGVAMSSWTVTGIATLLSYNLENRLHIPILPTALSSIVLTVLIYASIMVWILLPYITSLAERYAKDGSQLVTDHVFTISFVLIALICAPVLIYIVP